MWGHTHTRRAGPRLRGLLHPLYPRGRPVDVACAQSLVADWRKNDFRSSVACARLREADWWQTSFRSQLGQFEWKAMPFGLQGASSFLARVMNADMTRGLHPETSEPGAAGRAGAARAPPACQARAGRSMVRDGSHGRPPLLQSLAARSSASWAAVSRRRAWPLTRARWLPCTAGRPRRPTSSCAASLRGAVQLLPPLRRRLRGHRRPADPAVRSARALALGPRRTGGLHVRHAETVPDDGPRSPHLGLEPALRGRGRRQRGGYSGRPHPTRRRWSSPGDNTVAYESRKLKVAEQACPPQVLELPVLPCGCSTITS